MFIALLGTNYAIVYKIIGNKLSSKQNYYLK